MSRRIGITLGEPAGIGPELVVRTLGKNVWPDVSFSVYGSPALLESTARALHIDPFWNVSNNPPQNGGITLIPTGPDFSEARNDERSKPLRAEAVLAMLDRAFDDCLNGLLSALVTAPVDKSVVRCVRPDFTGHTEYLAERAGGVHPVMMMDNSEIRVVLVTNHLALRDVSKTVTSELLEKTIRVTVTSLRNMFGIEKPKVAVAGLNPHAGEIVTDSEEESIFKPVIQKLRSDGWAIEGPFSADTLFPLARNGRWDVILSPYHDQALVAAKYPGLDKVVNITLGLPILRVSPGHGVAYDLAGRDEADVRSFERALRIASAKRLVP
ncbi:MAG TPA: 4-hydroxythreonine-4-phosphate dehydrogenase PdxA [Bdellovibrionota bacterium]|nr:4-hydroxythreonine-4-phosphate dehydrogenase PdxA [Bdellovibrionota bacterium]